MKIYSEVYFLGSFCTFLVHWKRLLSFTLLVVMAHIKVKKKRTQKDIRGLSYQYQKRQWASTLIELHTVKISLITFN